MLARMLATGSVALAAVIALAGSAAANGRSPAASTITFRPGSTTEVVAGMTFGALFSSDGGVTWRWMCEAAVGYSGQYDPDYAVSSSGDVFATTFDGLRVDRDGCTFEPTVLGNTFVSSVETAGTAAVHASLAAPADTTIVASADDGVTFPTATSPGAAGDWWSSLRVAPSDTQRVYLTGYRIENGTRTFLMFTSTNGGTSFTPMTTTNLLVTSSSVVSIVGVAPETPTTVYAMVTFENTNTDGIYVSTDAGGSWTRITGGLGPLAFLARENGDLVVGNDAGAHVSIDGGMNWTDLPATTPRLYCMAERSDGEVWACTQPFVTGYAIMTSTNLTAWAPRLAFADIAGPIECAPGTVQHDTCRPLWCYLRLQLSITADPTGCDPPSNGTDVDGPIDAPVEPADAGRVRPRHGGESCCSSGRPGESLLFAVAFALVVLRKRRRDQFGPRR